MEQKRTGLSYVFTLVKGERGKLVAGMFLDILCSALSLVPYLVVYEILLLIIKNEVTSQDILMLPSMRKKVLWTFCGWAGIGVAAAILQAVLTSAAGICCHMAAFNTMHKIKVKVLEHMSGFNLGFFQEHAPGQIKTTLFDDVDRIETFLAHSTRELAQAAVVPLMMFLFMLRLHWIMALVMLVPMILGIAVPMMLMGRYPDMSDELAADTEKLNASANEFITAMPVIKMYHLTAEKFEQYRNALNLYTTCWKQMCVYSCNPLSIALVILDSAILFTLPVGGWLYLRGSLPVAAYLLFILLTMCFFTSFLNLITIAMQSMELGSGLDHIKKIMDMEEMKSGNRTLPKDGCYGIDFENVTFNYTLSHSACPERACDVKCQERYTKDEKDALSAVNLHLEPGSLNAFVGPSGAGKTTAVQLLGRYWDTTKGTIKIGGVPIMDLKTKNLMDLTAFVFQDVFLLEDTLLENIRMGTNATEEQVREAAKAAQIDDFIMGLPKGYATRIGDEGVKLSGGQQQRISIARAILKDAPIVVFDEATSYSDIENEHKIQLALQNLLKGKTTIMIAHRLHTIRDADKIVVFKNGMVAEQGTHRELVAKKGVYSQMWDVYTSACEARAPERAYVTGCPDGYTRETAGNPQEDTTMPFGEQKKPSRGYHDAIDKQKKPSRGYHDAIGKQKKPSRGYHDAIRQIEERRRPK